MGACVCPCMCIYAHMGQFYVMVRENFVEVGWFFLSNIWISGKQGHLPTQSSHQPGTNYLWVILV